MRCVSANSVFLSSQFIFFALNCDSRTYKHFLVLRWHNIRPCHQKMLEEHRIKNGLPFLVPVLLASVVWWSAGGFLASGVQETSVSYPPVSLASSLVCGVPVGSFLASFTGTPTSGFLTTQCVTPQQISWPSSGSQPHYLQ